MIFIMHTLMYNLLRELHKVILNLLVFTVDVISSEMYLDIYLDLWYWWDSPILLIFFLY